MPYVYTNICLLVLYVLKYLQSKRWTKVWKSLPLVIFIVKFFVSYNSAVCMPLVNVHSMHKDSLLLILWVHSKYTKLYTPWWFQCIRCMIRGIHCKAHDVCMYLSFPFSVCNVVSPAVPENNSVYEHKGHMTSSSEKLKANSQVLLYWP